MARIGYPERDEWLHDFDPARLESQSYKRILKQRYDIFSFWQRFPDTVPRYGYFMEWDNVAVLEIRTFQDWWQSIDRKTRNMVRKAEKSGVVVREVVPDDKFWSGIVEIYNETPIRQGKPFRHFGKNFADVKAKFEPWIPQSTFIGAYYGHELIGFIQMLHCDKYTLMSQILSKIKYLSKAPNNAMIAKAVEICSNRGVKYLIYAKMSGGSLGQFKRNNGFIERHVPRYYIPLTLKGKIILFLHLHHGIRGIIPKQIKDKLRLIRKRYFETVLKSSKQSHS
ncbi:MAG: hypothetical protein QXI71_03450 [Candidatus Bathyarchaeia archaeon]|nr:hypothetical protein [Candidatus Bathyarchaeota archaeon]